MRRKVTNYSLVVLVLTICFGLMQAKKENKNPFNSSFYSNSLYIGSSGCYLYRGLNMSKNTDYSKNYIHLENTGIKKSLIDYYSNNREFNYLNPTSKFYYLENLNFNLIKY